MDGGSANKNLEEKQQTDCEGRTIVEKSPTPPDSESILSLIQQSLDDDKADRVVAIDLAGKTSIADFMVIATGNTRRQVGAMTQHLRERLKTAGLKGLSIEGEANGDWVLIDSGDVIVHLFRPEVRAFYNLEKLWGEALPESIDRASTVASA